MNSLLDKYRKLTMPVKASLWFIVASFLQKGISMLTTPIFTRLLTMEQYGTVSTYQAWQSTLLIIVTLMMEKSLMNLYVKHNESKEKILSSILCLSLFLSFLWFIVFLFLHKYIAMLLGLSETLVFFMFISFMATPALSCWSMYKRYTYDYKGLTKVTLLSTIFSAILTVTGVLILQNKAEAKVGAEVIVMSVIAAGIYIYWFKKYKCFIKKEIWIFSLTFCGALLPHYLSEIVLSRSDRIMINYFCGASDVAIYSVAYSVSALIMIFTSSINASFAPYQYQQIQKGEYKKLMQVGNQVLAFVAIMLGLIMLFGSEIIWIFGGQKYKASVYLIPPLCLGIFFNYTFQIFARAQEYFEKKKNIVIVSISCAVMNLLLNYITIPLFGYQAVAYTTFFSYMVFCMIHYCIYLRLLKTNLNGNRIYDIKTISIISIGLMIFAIIAFVLYSHFWIKLIVIALVIVTVFLNHKKMIYLFESILNRIIKK